MDAMSDPLQSWKDEWQSQIGSERILRVRWLLNPHEPPLENVEIVEQHGHITEIRPLAGTADKILPVIMIPTLVNAHTHLEFSALSEPIRPALPFPDWIAAVIQWRRSTVDDNTDGVPQGLMESYRAGVSTIGEITTTQQVNALDLAEGCRVVSFREIIALQRDRIPELLCQAEQHLEADADESIICGISPHAPYTVHPELFESLMELAVNRNAIVAMHLAETKDELELLHDGSGRFVDFLSQLGLWNASTFPGGRSVRDFLEQLVRTPRALAIHGNYFSDEDIRFVARHSNLATVYCPRTHASFGHEQHPIQRLLAAGARVVLGTDSRASNPDLSVWKELQFVAAHFPDLSIPQLLAMVTTEAADSLGLAVDNYSIRAGRQLRCVTLNMSSMKSDLRAVICDSTTQPAISIHKGTVSR
jgi:cytosine/adenosine deaminase-related metal-dependent hydrolase